MNVIILAAGCGKRLGKNIPKNLNLITDDKTIFDCQLEIIEKYINTENIFVIVGYKANEIMNHRPDLNYVHNSNYLNNNTAKSLALGLEKVTNDLIWLNGDVVFEEPVFLSLLNSSGNTILVNSESVGEEEIKYTLDDDGYVNKLSKTVRDGEGEALGLNKIKFNQVKTLTDCLLSCDDHDYFEKGIEFAINRGVKFSTVNIGKQKCIEIDFQQDLDRAREMYLEKA